MEASKKYNKKWEDEEIEKLIDLYEVNPCLWDIFDKSYQKRDEREKALAAIAEELDVQIADIKIKWNAIRGQFGRELNKVKVSKSGQSADDLYVSQWVFWDKLRFLQSVMKTTKSRDTLSLGTEGIEKSSNICLSSDEVDEDREVADISIEDTTSKEMKSSKAKKRK